MLRRTKILAVGAAVAATVAAPAPPAAAVDFCQVRATGVGTGFTQTILVTGEYAPAGAVDVRLTCGVVKNGFTVARFTDQLTGPAAVVAGTVNLSAGPIYACRESIAYFADGSITQYDTCP